MKIHPSKIDFFLNKDFAKYKGVLIFGNDIGLVYKRSSVLEKKFLKLHELDNMASVNLNYAQFSKDSSVLYEAINSYSIFSAYKVITIDNVSKSLDKKIAQILSDRTDSNFIIFKAEELPTSSGVRKFFEKQADLAVIACYHETNDNIKVLLLNKLEQKNIKISSKEVMDYIVENIQGDHLSLISEIDKILLYFKPNSSLELKDAKAIINKNCYNSNYDDLIQYIILNKLDKAEIEFLNLINLGTHVVAITRNLANFFIKLLKVKTLIEQGKNEVAAMSFLKPPIFYKYKAAFKFGFEKYSISKLINIINELTILEKDCKTNNIDSRIMWNLKFLELFADTKLLYN